MPSLPVASTRRTISDAAENLAYRGMDIADRYVGYPPFTGTPTNRVLMYHSVGGGFYDDISPDHFRQQLTRLTRSFEIVDLPAVLADSSEKRIALTFDDGTRDFYEHVRPILHEFEVPATVFVIADTLEEDQFVHDDLYDYEYMTRHQLRDLVDDELVTVGNHTKSHPRLDEVTSADALRQEIEGAKRTLERELRTSVDRFCYPYGHYSPSALEIVRETHAMATQMSGKDYRISPGTDSHLVPRINGATDLYRLGWGLSDFSAPAARALG